LIRSLSRNLLRGGPFQRLLGFIAFLEHGCSVFGAA
jgi:hypothetical protein